MYPTCNKFEFVWTMSLVQQQVTLHRNINSCYANIFKCSNINDASFNWYTSRLLEQHSNADLIVACCLDDDDNCCSRCRLATAAAEGCFQIKTLGTVPAFSIFTVIVLPAKYTKIKPIWCNLTLVRQIPPCPSSPFPSFLSPSLPSLRSRNFV